MKSVSNIVREENIQCALMRYFFTFEGLYMTHGISKNYIIGNQDFVL